MSRSSFLFPIVLVLSLPLADCPQAQAADIVVDTSSDSDFFPTGTCKLRQAVEAANTDNAVGNCTAGDGADRIVFDGVATVTLRSGSLQITEALTLDGDGTLVTIRRNPDDNDSFRILDDTSGDTLTLRWIAIENGVLDSNADNRGAGIRSTGTVILEDSRVSSNVASAVDSLGGGIDAAGDVQLLRSEVSGNTASKQGGGVRGVAVTLTDSVVVGNTLTHATGRGGGVYSFSTVDAIRSRLSNNRVLQDGGAIAGDTVTLVDTQVEGNAATGATGAGGGVYASQSTITGSTLSNNDAGQQGGGMFSIFLTLRNSTVSGNVATLCGGGLTGFVVSIQNSTITDNGADDNATGGICAAATDDQPHSLAISNSIVHGNLGDIGTILDAVDVAGINNIIGPVGGSVTLPADTVDCDPQLAPLADNGGFTTTHAIGMGSCARDGATNPFDFPTDQRGAVRTAGAATDIGAFELQLVEVFSDGFED